MVALLILKSLSWMLKNEKLRPKIRALTAHSI